MTISRLEFLANFLGGILVGVVFACVVSIDEFVSIRGRSLQWSRHEAKEAPLGRELPPAALDPSAWNDITGNDSLTESIPLQSSSELEAKIMRRGRILCWVLTSPDNIETRAVHVNRTWGRRCDVLLFMTTKGDPRGSGDLVLPAVELDVPEGHHRLWGKTKAAFRYVYDRHLHDADWFFKADDDTYAVVENLRRLLDSYDPDEALYLGRRLTAPSADVDASYMSGGAGYVLSREAVRRLVAVGLLGPCGGGGGGEHEDDHGHEDVRLGACMTSCNVSFVDTRDSVGRHRFHPIAPWHYLSHQVFPDDYWLARRDYYAGKAGVKCCSLYSITFHYIPDYAMYWMDFILYRFKISGSAKVIFDQHLAQKEQQKVQRMKSKVHSQRRS